jgi:tricarballylate dehydrogenase
MDDGYDVVVVGAGNAAIAAALSAREAGKSVLVLERADESDAGGNSYYTGGLFRFPHTGLEDICELLPQLAEGSINDLELDEYPESAFYADMGHMTRYRCDPELTEILVTHAREDLAWLAGYGVTFLWSRGRHSYNVNGKFRFWGGAPLEVNGGGAGLMEQLFKACAEKDIEIQYGQRAVDLLVNDDNSIGGVRVATAEGRRDIRSDSVVLACGGFEANGEWRARYLGPNWDLARVRGTKFNTGDGHEMAMRAGARSFGHWSGCHATAWDANSPIDSERGKGDSSSRHSYPMGIVVNENGERFLDEGADFHTHTYAKYGAEILKQPGLVAHQIFDQKTLQYLRSDYRDKNVTRDTADTLEELAKKIDVDPGSLVKTVRDFNAAVEDGEFNPNLLDGKRTNGLTPDKTNWALPLDSPPYLAYSVTTGITFTFGGLRINSKSQVLDWANTPVKGLYAAGEIVGGLFYHNYPSGTGLMAGTVFGRIAGQNVGQ